MHTSRISSAIHSYYRRKPLELPCAGKSLRLLLSVKKFFCRVASCSRKVFTERLPELIEPSSRLTTRRLRIVQAICAAFNANGGVRLAEQLGQYRSPLSSSGRASPATTSSAIATLLDPYYDYLYEFLPLTPEQVQQLLVSAVGDRLEALFVLALATGMRRGELLALKWQDVNFTTGTLQVRRVLAHESVKFAGKGGFVEAEPKTERSRRSIVIASFALEKLRESTGFDSWRQNSRLARYGKSAILYSAQLSERISYLVAFHNRM